MSGYTFTPAHRLSMTPATFDVAPTAGGTATFLVEMELHADVALFGATVTNADAILLTDAVVNMPVS